MMERYFRLSEHNTTARREMLCGVTIFLTMMYILFTNSGILSEVGMPWQGVFMGTALSAAVCTIVVSMYANLPFAMAPGMGLNALFAYTICKGMGYHWKEALAISFLAGIGHVILMASPLRKGLVNAFPGYLRVASGVGLGIFIAWVGIKNTGLLVYSFPAPSEVLGGSLTVSGVDLIPSLTKSISGAQIVTIVGLVVMTILSALEKRTGDRYAALPIGIIIATFIGVPLNVTQMDAPVFIEVSMTEGFSRIFLSFFGAPGLLSIFRSPEVIFRTLLMMAILIMTSLLDSIGTMIGIGQIHGAKLFDSKDVDKFSKKGAESKLDRALIANSLGNTISPLFGTSPSTVYLESVTGIVSGGRTGLTGLVTGVLFLLCIPLSGFFQIIPGEAVAPALIFAGLSMLTRMRYIDWRNFEEALPSFVTILFIPFAYSILDGISVGVISHVIVQLSLGNRRKIHPVLFVLSAMYILLKMGDVLLQI